ncbi:hypothetical protein [Kordia sp.]|uniref:hypothetical protein n=1 Tax=Kordia sp. TaxID=1965332 RepID=UPI003B5CFF63
MKKKQLKNLALNKRSISNFSEKIKGGETYITDKIPEKPIDLPSDHWSNCHVEPLTIETICWTKPNEGDTFTYYTCNN